MNLSAYLKEQTSLINKELDKLIPEKDVPHGLLYKAARYSLMAPSKRLRPILTLATAKMLGASSKTALLPACALELVHTYSLIHDDLPSMDDDHLRRGKPTLHKVYPEGQAILAGDFLLTLAFETLTNVPSLTAEQKISLVSTLSQRSGSKGMIGGQVMDLFSEGKTLSLETLQQIHSYKTAAMIMASVEFGGIVAQATKKEMDSLRIFGQDIGLAFQIIDDILDVTSSDGELGKPVGSDHAKNKATYISILGYEQSNKIAKKLCHSALNSLSQLSCDTSILSSLADLIISRSS